MNKTNLSSSTGCKCRDRHIECLDCSFGDHDEHCQPDSPQLSKCCKAPVATAHGCDSDLGHMGKPCTCEIVTMWYECTKCKKPCDLDIKLTTGSTTDESMKYIKAETKDSTSEFIPAFSTDNTLNDNVNQNGNNDSMKEKVDKWLYQRKENITIYPYFSVHLTDFILALFQSQESKTLERVREKVEELKSEEIPTAILDEEFQQTIWKQATEGALENVLDILEAEQKGSK